MSHPLLLQSSYIFDNSCTVDDIRQSYIDLHKETIQKEVQILLKKAILSFDNEIKPELASELFQLILTCFSCYPTEFIPAFESLFKRSKVNSNYLICTVSVLSYLTRNAKCLSISNYSAFVTEAINELIPQIKISNIIDPTIYGQTIPSQFKSNFITNLLLCSNLTSEISTVLFPLIFPNFKEIDNKSNLEMLISDIFSSGLEQYLPDTIMNDKEFLLSLNNESIGIILQFVPLAIFKDLFSQIDANFSKAEKLSSKAALNFIMKCKEGEMEPKAVLNLIKFLNESDLTNDVISYLKKFEILVPYNVVSRFINIEDHEFLFKINLEPCNMPDDLLKEGLYHSSNIDFVSRYVESPNSSKTVLQDKNFIMHAYSIFSECKNVKSFVKLFVEYLSKDDFNNLFDEIVFSTYPPTYNHGMLLKNVFQTIAFKYKEKYCEINHMLKLINEVVRIGKIPSIPFIQILSYNIACNVLQNQKLHDNILMQIIVTFAILNRKNPKSFDEITILPYSSETDHLLQKMVESTDFSLFSSFNFESASLTVAAFNYNWSKSTMKIKGLTKDNVLKFICLALRFSAVFDYNDLLFPDSFYFPSNTMNLFKEEINYFLQNESKDIQKWIDLIFLQNNHKNLYLQFFIEYNIQEFIDLFIDIIYKNGFHANKEYIVAFLANKRPTSIYAMNCIINNLSPKDYESIEIKQKFHFHDIEELSEIISKNIGNENSSADFILSNILFIEHMCTDQIQIHIQNFSSNLKEVLFKAYNEGMKNEVQFIRNIAINNGLIPQYSEMIQQLQKDTINSETNLDEIISSILSCQSLEKNDDLLEKLFNYMIIDESNIIGYLMTYIESCSKCQEIDISVLLNNYLDEYCKYGVNFIKAINNLMLLNEKNKFFVFRLYYPIIECSKDYKSLIPNLFKSIQEKSDNFNAFICLKSIMCTFPFLFENPQEIFDNVFAALNNYSLIFEEEKEDQTNKIKTAISALSFLLSSLNVNKIMDPFIDYVFSNISSFSNSQIFCVNFCFLSILQTPVIGQLLISKLYKYNFLNIVISMMERDITDENFKDNYDNIIFLVLNSYFSIINKLDRNDLLLVDERIEINNLFSLYFDGRISTLPYQIKFNQTILKFKNEISSFIENVEKMRPFWLSEKQCNSIHLDKEVDCFINDYKKITNTKENQIKLTPSYFNIFDKTNYTIHYLAKQKTWALNWFLYNEKFNGFNEHLDYLKEVYNHISTKKKNSNMKINSIVHNYNELFIKKFIFDEILSLRFRKTNEKDLIEFVFTIVNNKKSSKCFINYMTDFLNHQEIVSPELLLKLIHLFQRLKCSDYFSSFIHEKSSVTIIKFALQLQNRNKKELQIDLCNLISTYPKLPESATQFLNFLYLSNDSQLKMEALKLCSKFSDEAIKKYLLLQSAFDQEIKKENPSVDLIYNFYKFAPSVFQTRSPELCDLLKTFFKKYQIEEKDKSSQSYKTLAEMIINIINLISPRRNISCSFVSDSTQNQPALEDAPKYRIPRRIYELFPKFFDVFLENRKYIDQIISFKKIELESFIIYKHFPELIDFQVRFTKFQTKQHNKIDTGYSKYLHINPEIILADSYDELGNASAETWRRQIKISYENMSGIDMGGLRRDWFTKLAKELFDPKTEFFQISGENMCLQPSPLSVKIPNYQKYFSFAGKFVARAIMENVCINVHFTRSFLKQILGHPLRMSDLDNIDEHYRTSLDYIIKNNFDENDLGMYFEVTDCIDKYKSFELIPNGSEIPITNKNKMEYVNLAMQYYLRTSMINQIKSFCSGFNSLIPHNEIKAFSPVELNLIISGVPEIDIEDFKQNVRSEYDRDSTVFKLFFECISKWNKVELAMLLMFITGSSQVPPNGFVHFKNTGHPIRISKVSDISALPVAHTCFNTIDLPPYNTLAMMNEKLRYAISECDGFLIA